MKAALFAGLCLICFSIFAEDVWFGGPFFVPPGRTYPKDHTQVKITSVFFDNMTFIDRGPMVVSALSRSSNQYISTFRHGLSDFLDVLVALPYIMNKQQDKRGEGVGDVQVLLGYQLMKPIQNSAKPYLRLILQESIPSGRYDRLSVEKSSTDLTGRGDYRTYVALNFESISEPVSDHFLRARLNVGYLVGTPVVVNGLNHYGGGMRTKGRVYPSEWLNANLSLEYKLTERWILLAEVLYAFSTPSNFVGQAGKTLMGHPAKMTRGTQASLSYLPGIEYCFSKTYSLNVGYWFVPKQDNDTHFSAIAIALNAKW